MKAENRYTTLCNKVVGLDNHLVLETRKKSQGLNSENIMVVESGRSHVGATAPRILLLWAFPQTKSLRDISKT
jgi:hypothetical protein